MIAKIKLDDPRWQTEPFITYRAIADKVCARLKEKGCNPELAQKVEIEEDNPGKGITCKFIVTDKYKKLGRLGISRDAMQITFTMLAAQREHVFTAQAIKSDLRTFGDTDRFQIVPGNAPIANAWAIEDCTAQKIVKIVSKDERPVWTMPWKDIVPVR